MDEITNNTQARFWIALTFLALLTSTVIMCGISAKVARNERQNIQDSIHFIIDHSEIKDTI
jgi:hypothetical protein